MFRTLVALSALLVAAPQALGAGRAALSVSVTVVRSIAVTISGSAPSDAAVSIRAPDGARWSTRLADVAPGRGVSLGARAGLGGDDDYVVVTVLADAPLRR